MYGHTDHLTVSGFDPPTSISNMGRVDDAERIDRIRNAYFAYFGQTPDPLKKRKGETTNDSVKINYARLVVDTGVATLFGDDLQILAPSEQESLQEWVEGVVRANGGGLLWQRLGMAGAIGGTMYYRILVTEDEMPRIVVLDPENMEMEWDPDDHEKIVRYVYTWLPNDEERSVARRLMIEPTSETAWQVLEQEATDDGEWRTIDTEVWPYPFPPVGHCQNLPSPHEVYGISDLEPDVLRLIMAIERVVSNINRLVRLYAHPRTWGRMVGDALNLDANPGSIIRLEHPQGELRNLEMSSDLQSSLRLYESLQAALFETTRIPALAAGKMDSVGQLSALALKIMYAPLVAKTESKRRTYGNAIEEMFRRLAAVAGYGDDMRVSIVWSDIIPVDDEATRRIALLDKQLGVSKATILERLGYDPERELEMSQEEAEASVQLFANTGAPPDEPDDD